MSEKKKVLEVDLKGADGNIFVVMGKSRSIIKRTKEKRDDKTSNAVKEL